MKWLSEYCEDLEKLNSHSWITAPNKCDMVCAVCGLPAIYGIGANIKNEDEWFNKDEYGWFVPAYCGPVYSCNESVIKQVLE